MRGRFGVSAAIASEPPINAKTRAEVASFIKSIVTLELVRLSGVYKRLITPVRIEGVWKAYGSTPAVRGLSLSVPSQSVYGFLGPNGAGKSTTIRMMLGLQRP